MMSRRIGAYVHCTTDERRMQNIGVMYNTPVYLVLLGCVRLIVGTVWNVHECVSLL